VKKSDISIPLIPDLYHVTSQDFSKACIILGDAFRDDPIWKEILKEDLDKISHVFGVPLKYTLKYGALYSTLENLEGIAGWLPSTYMNMNFFRLLWSGAILSALKLGS
jgi:hypothetical protein